MKVMSLFLLFSSLLSLSLSFSSLLLSFTSSNFLERSSFPILSNGHLLIALSKRGLSVGERKIMEERFLSPMSGLFFEAILQWSSFFTSKLNQANR